MYNVCCILYGYVLLSVSVLAMYLSIESVAHLAVGHCAPRATVTGRMHVLQCAEARNISETGESQDSS